LLCGQDVTGEAYQISTYSRRSSSDSYTGGTLVSCTPSQSEFTKTLASKTVQVSVYLMFYLYFFLQWYYDDVQEGERDYSWWATYARDMKQQRNELKTDVCDVSQW